MSLKIAFKMPKVDNMYQTNEKVVSILTFYPNCSKEEPCFVPIYIGLVSYIQFYYQRGCLYRLRCLGLRDNEMDITVEGFQHWIWKELSFLLPFLCVGYIWQLYHSYTLYILSLTDDSEWHVFALSVLFAILGVGNIIATILTITKKIRDREVAKLKLKLAYLLQI